MSGGGGLTIEETFSEPFPSIEDSKEFENQQLGFEDNGHFTFEQGQAIDGQWEENGYPESWFI